MALNLSESRRLASRRNVSQQLPPRLAPVSDSAVGGNLLRQLQQQRRISRTMSPKPERTASGARTSSGHYSPNQGTPRASTSSALQPAYELLPDGSPGGQNQNQNQNAYRYHFSQSTLARAQKAKEYLELLAQHRRLLELIPPLTPEATPCSRAASFGSPPSTSANSGQLQSQSLALIGTNNNGEPLPGSIRLGRAYNPLQYIRNRKVRVRKRLTIDGQAQGFGDVNKTVEWVDEVAKWAATGKAQMSGRFTLPAFSSADADANLQNSPPPASSRVGGQGSLVKLKRPRIDWYIDPADMIADVYWLEKDDNKLLLEDHDWQPVFPQSQNRPVSQRTDDASSPHKPGDQTEFPGPLPIVTVDGDASGAGARPLLTPATGSQSQYKTMDHSPEQNQSSARRRARQKINELRTFHHRHNSSAYAQDVARLWRSSFSDTSDSDSDRKRFNRVRAGSPAPMSEKLVGFGREKDDNAAATAAATALKEQTRPSPASAASAVMTPVNGKKPASDPSTTAALSHKPAEAALRSPSKPGRASLEVPSVGYRLSLDYDSSRPASPELRPFTNDGLGFVPPLGSDLSSPPSRTTSPPRHRFGKVKSMFRDHSRDRGRERERERERERDKERANQAMLDRGEHYLEPASVRTAKAQQQEQQEHNDLVLPPLVITTSAEDDVRVASGQEEKKISRSPRRNKSGSRAGRGAFDSQRSHASISNTTAYGQSNSRGEEGGPSSASGSGGSTLRGLFKGGPRIDTMLRSGVSKVSDMIWRREGSEAPLLGESAAAAAAADMSSSSSSSSDSDSSESEAIAPRGRFGKKSPLPSRTSSVMPGDKLSQQTSKSGEKHYLDVMPTFGRGSDPINRPPSRQSARFERLKPPRIDVRDASPTTTADDVAKKPATQLGAAARSASRRNSSLQPLYRRLQQDSDYSGSEGRSRRGSHVSGAASSVNGSINGGVGGGNLQHMQRQFGSMSSGVGRGSSRPRWSMSQPALKKRGSLSRRELARLHASMYMSAILAKELLRHANEPRLLTPSWNNGDDDNDDDNDNSNSNNNNNMRTKKRRSSKVLGEVDVGEDADANADADDEDGHDEDAEAPQHGSGAGSGPIVVRGTNGETSLTWADIAAYAPNPSELTRRPIKQVEMYPLAAQVLGGAIQRSGMSWQKSAERFANSTVPELRQRIEGVRTRVAVELSGLARQAADEADEVTRDLMVVQRLQVKRVEDSIETMLRRRRRRFRWVRRAGWLTVEWLLVGFMWYVWFVVMLARIVLGFGRGVYAGVRWLLWL